MLLDLIRALLAVLVVAVAPGWFWARLLLASEDRVERTVYSAALSMALVPVAALVPVYLLETGVTLAVASVSALAVFLSGLVAYLRLGQAKGSSEPLIPLPSSPLSAPTLALLLPAFGLAMEGTDRRRPRQVGRASDHGRGRPGISGSDPDLLAGARGRPPPAGPVPAYRDGSVTEPSSRLFEAHPDLYRKAFENRDVLIVKPRV